MPHTYRSNTLIERLYLRVLSRGGLVVLAIVLVVNLASLGLIDRANLELDTSRTAQVHSRDVMSAIERIETLVFEAESAQRGYLYTDKREYIGPMYDNEKEILKRLNELRLKVADSPSQTALFSRIDAITREKLKELNETVAFFEMNRKEAARDVVAAGWGKQLMEQFESEVNKFLKAEDAVRLERAQYRAEVQQRIRYGIALILSLNVILIMLSGDTIVRDLAAREAAAERAQAARDSLEAEVKARTAELRALSVHLQRVQEEERRSVARELHDELGGTLSAIRMDLAMARDAATKLADEKSAGRLKRALDALDGAIKFNRALIEDLRPSLLDNLGLASALRWQCEQFSARTGCACRTELPDDAVSQSLSSAQSIALYRVVQEGLTNALKYAKAREISVSLEAQHEHWLLVLQDDGRGFDCTQSKTTTSHGIVGMRERVAALGGTFSISSEPGQGTRIEVHLPMVESDSYAPIAC